MARRDFAAELSKKPIGFKVGILAGVLAVLGFFYWQFFYSTLSDERTSLTTQRKKLSKQDKKLKQREKKWLELLQKKEVLDAQLKKNRITLPASSELPAFFMHLQKQAAAAGVTVTSWTRRKESAVETYVRVPVTIQLTGTFYQISNYFRLLSQTDRIISVSGLKLSPGRVKNEEIILKASFTAVTFRQKDRPPDTTLADENEPAPAEKPAKGSRKGAGRFAAGAADQAEAVRKETGDQAKRETGGQR
jgi:Tfp pilus assembly protein PilO